MPKNQKLSLVAIVFLVVASVATWKMVPRDDTAHAAPIALTTTPTPKEGFTERLMSAKEAEVPEKIKKVEHALDDRWGHMDEPALTAASVDPEGDSVFYSKQVFSGLNGKGDPIYARAILQTTLFQGPKFTERHHEPVIGTSVKANLDGGLLVQALRKGKLADRKAKQAQAGKGAASDE